MDSQFFQVFYITFAQIFDLIMYHPLNFPEPIGTITIFDFSVFFIVADLLAGLVNNIASRRGDDT